mmetsp:Transcript_5552/g.12749  ORF Transcript_5552/g.12749 Transcript_5552/m.12749 type:complete len:260 (+) Transcript_5552:350-1129(+)
MQRGQLRRRQGLVVAEQRASACVRVSGPRIGIGINLVEATSLKSDSGRNVLCNTRLRRRTRVGPEGHLHHRRRLGGTPPAPGSGLRFLCLPPEGVVHGTIAVRSDNTGMGRSLGRDGPGRSRETGTGEWRLELASPQQRNRRHRKSRRRQSRQPRLPRRSGFYSAGRRTSGVAGNVPGGSPGSPPKRRFAAQLPPVRGLPCQPAEDGTELPPGHVQHKAKETVPAEHRGTGVLLDELAASPHDLSVDFVSRVGSEPHSE